MEKEVSGGSTSPGGLPNVIMQKVVFIFDDVGRATFFAWLSPSYFELFSSPSGDAMLESWLNGLEFDPETLKDPSVADDY